MTTSQFGNKRTFHSHNLYQIFTYVKNKDKYNDGNVSGLLLYAKTDEEITPNAEFGMDGNRIAIRSLDLNEEFWKIEEQLKSLINRLFLKGE